LSLLVPDIVVVVIIIIAVVAVSPKVTICGVVLSVAMRWIFMQA